MLVLKNVNKVYGKKKMARQVLKDVSLTFPDRGLFFILGKSGSGKSTLLNIIGGLDGATSGEILLNGKDITKWNKKEMTAYRSTYMGFVFQDYNLIDELTVSENISLIETDKKKVEKILNYFEVAQIKDNEASKISGGEKQRVSIARALIKEPKILLCDEPTGNLDSTNSEEVFKILKKISEKTLVLVVTHDEESALKYSKNIVRIVDGEVATEPTIIDDEPTSQIELKSKKLSMANKLKLSIANLKHRKLRLVLTIVLSIVAFVSYGLSNSLNGYVEEKVHAETLVKENVNKIYVQKKSGFGLNRILNDKYITYINENIASPKIYSSYITAKDTEYGLDGFFSGLKEELKDNAFYAQSFLDRNPLYFDVYTDELIHTLDIVGTFPEKKNEILIPEIVADLMTSRTFTYKENEKEVEKEFENKEAVIGFSFPFEDTELTITGYVKDKSLAKYEGLKKESYNYLMTHPTKLYQEFERSYFKTNDDVQDIQKVIVNTKFFDLLELKSNSKIKEDLFPNILTYNDKMTYISLLAVLDEEKEALTKEGIKKIKELKDDEILLSRYTLRELFKEEFTLRYEKEWSEALLKYKDEMYAYNKEIEENPNLSIEPPKKPDDNKIEMDILESLMINNGMFENAIDAEMIDVYKIVSENREEHHTLKIVGLMNDVMEMHSRVGEPFQKYVLPNQVTTGINIYENREEKLEEMLTFLKSDAMLSVTTKYSEVIATTTKVVKKLKVILQYVTIILLIFAVALLSNFIYTSISFNKRKIGILSSLGVRLKDCVDIFLIENLLISLTVFVLSTGLTYSLINLANIYVTNSMQFFIRMFSYDKSIIGFMIWAILFSLVISSILPIIRLHKIKPIDAIKMN